MRKVLLFALILIGGCSNHKAIHKNILKEEVRISLEIDSLKVKQKEIIRLLDIETLKEIKGE